MQPAESSNAWWLTPHLWSLDAPLVAVVWLGAFGTAHGVPVPPTTFALLALAVWVIYVTDRLWDVRRMPDLATAPLRHRYYARHFTRFLRLAGIAFLAGATLAALALPWEILSLGAGLGFLVGLYFHQLQGTTTLFIPKELACGMIFAGGTICGLAPSFSRQLLVEAALFGLLCTSNCLLIAHWERAMDAANDPRALPRRHPALARRLSLLLPAGLIALPLLAGLSPVNLSIAAASAALLALALLARGGFLSPDLRRVLADAALLTPLFLVPIFQHST